MAVRANLDLKNAIIKTFTVASGTVNAGRDVKFASNDLEVTQAGAGDGDLAFGIALDTGTAGKQVQVALYGTALVGKIVGTGGATRGVKQKLAADGTTDITAGTDIVRGRAMQSGVVGDLIGVLVGGW